VGRRKVKGRDDERSGERRKGGGQKSERREDIGKYKRKKKVESRSALRLKSQEEIKLEKRYSEDLEEQKKCSV
jgi:hypothetical protein